jgi:hypothetical protein
MRREQPILYVIHTSEPELVDGGWSPGPTAAPWSAVTRELEPHYLPSLNTKGRAEEIIEGYGEPPECMFDAPCAKADIRSGEINGGNSMMVPIVTIAIAVVFTCMLM